MFLLDNRLLLHMLKEDTPYGDQTTRSLAFGKDSGQILFHRSRSRAAGPIR
jgi:hypothetical protein